MKTKNKILLISFSILLIALIAILATYFSGAWFIATRRAEGTLEFVEGIKIDYSNMYKQNSSATNTNLKLQTADGNILEIKDVTSDLVFEIKNPTLTPKEDTVSYFLRAKLNYSYYYKDNYGNEIEITNLTRNNFLQKCAGYQRLVDNNGEKVYESVTISNEKELFAFLPQLDRTKFVEFDNWFYLGSAETEINSLNDITLESCFYNGDETKSISLFENNSENKVVLALDNTIDYGEQMPFSKLVITLDIQAVEETAISIWSWQKIRIFADKPS